IFSHRYVVIYKNDQEGIESLKEMIQHFQKIVDDKDKKVAAIQKSRPVSMLKTVLHPDLIDSKAISMSIEGTVSDQEGEPLIGVNIQVKGSNKGTTTDLDGR